MSHAQTHLSPAKGAAVAARKQQHSDATLVTIVTMLVGLCAMSFYLQEILR
jgi:hypothetical protein